MRICLAAVALIALVSSGQGCAAQAAVPPSWQPVHTDRYDPLLTVRAGSDSRCSYLWNGGPIVDSKLIELGADFLKAAVERIGPANVTRENMPVAKLQFDGNVLYRCVRRTIEASAMMGFVEIRIDNPRPGIDPWVQPLVFTVEETIPDRPGIDPVHNRLALDGRGFPVWNGAGIDWVTLRQYCDLTQQMNPIPWLALDIDEAISYRQVAPLLTIVWRSHAQSITFGAPRAAAGRTSVLTLRASYEVRRLR